MEVHDERRAAAIARLEARRDVRRHVVVYLLVNALLVVVWAASGAGYFWPIWPIAGWGIAVVLHAWSIYRERPIDEDAIRREMRRSPR